MELFGSLWKSKNNTYRRDNFGLCVDFHSHIIPMIDDGSSSIDESVKMLMSMRELGFSKFVVTPHVRTEVFPNTVKTISNGYNLLIDSLKNIDVEISVAAEYMLDEGFDKIVQSGDLMTFGDNYVLIELSHLMTVGGLWQMIFDLQIARYRVVLAHPERYAYFDMDIYEELKNRGVIFQLNGASLVGAYGRQVQKTAERFIDNGWIELIGSDLHSSKAVEIYSKVCKTKHYAKLFNSGNLINDKLF